eukprot:7590285-Pyramimonas_sp.AAC.1
MLSALTRLAPTTGICSLPSHDWLPLRAYAIYPHAIGSRYGHMLSALTRLAGLARPDAPLSSGGGRSRGRWTPPRAS